MPNAGVPNIGIANMGLANVGIPNMGMHAHTAPSECVLIGGAGWYVQGLLGILSFATLVVKRQMECPKRSWMIWSLDASKQAIGALFAHLMNMVSAASQAALSVKGDSCEWYWLNIVLDATLGVFISYILLRILLRSAYLLRRYPLGPIKFGQYGDPPAFTLWLDQLLIWLFVTFLMKLICLLAMSVFQVPLISFAQLFLSELNGQPLLKLFAVMILTPVFMNSIQYWITDNILMAQSASTHSWIFTTPNPSHDPLTRIADVSQAKMFAV